MSGLVVGLVAGVGLFLVWSACWVPSPRSDTPRAVNRRVAAFHDDLVLAGFPRASIAQVVAVCLAVGVLVFGIAWVIIGVATIALAFGIIGAQLPILYLRRRARTRRANVRHAWPDAVDNITSGVRAGMALPEAVSQLGERGPEVLRPAFAAFAAEYRVSGRFNESLDHLKARLADPVADRLVESLRIAREVGGSDLGGLLRTLSAYLREDARTRGELETRQSWTVNAARLAVAAPWVVLAMLSTNGDAVRAYGSTAGAVVLASGGALTVLAYLFMKRIARLPEDRRVLR